MRCDGVCGGAIIDTTVSMDDSTVPVDVDKISLLAGVDSTDDCVNKCSNKLEQSCRRDFLDSFVSS